ncbi:MAG: alpha/beta hydrolase [Patescibacteria group bacterium]
MKTNLVEFKNQNDDVLRGIEVTSGNLGNREGVIFLGGFERKTSTEPQFKRMADLLIAMDVPSFRFDYTGLGLSDGAFRSVTNSRMVSDLLAATEVFKSRNRLNSLSFVVHSNSACVLVSSSLAILASRIVFLAPAFDQINLSKFWFTQKRMSKIDSNIKITWLNYNKYFSNTEFRRFVIQDSKMTKQNYLDSAYHLYNTEVDYTSIAETFSQKSMVVIGSEDRVTPRESLHYNCSKLLIVDQGDHYLARPDMLDQWLKKAINFLKLV